MVKWQKSYPDIALQTRAQKEKKKVGPTKAEIVTKFLDELKEDSGRKKYTLNDLGWVHQSQSSWCDLKSDLGQIIGSATKFWTNFQKSGSNPYPNPPKLTNEPSIGGQKEAGTVQDGGRS